MKKTALLLLLTITGWLAYAQKYTSEKSVIVFFSKASIESFEATNLKGSSIFNAANQEIVFAVPIYEFEFDKPLMKDQFNSKYMESETFPKSTFSGKLTGYQPATVGEQTVHAVGKLTMHGVAHEVDIVGTALNEGGKIKMKSVFRVKLEDYKIKIPKIMWQKIAEEIEVKVEFVFNPL